MSLFIVNCAKGWDLETKEKIRSDITKKMGAIARVSDKLMAVLFHEYEAENMSPNHGCFVIVYMSEGRTDEFKDELVAVVTDAITEHTDFDDGKVAVMIHDVLKGNMAARRKIVNRGGPVAQLINDGELDPEEL